MSGASEMLDDALDDDEIQFCWCGAMLDPGQEWCGIDFICRNHLAETGGPE